MPFKKISYLEWYRKFIGKVQYDLARPNVKLLTKEELGLEIEHIELSRNDESSCEELVSLIAQKYKVEPSHVFIANGGTMAIFLVCAALIEEGDDILLEAPNYEPLYLIPQQFRARIKILERTFENGFQIDLEELERKISRNAKMIILTNLHNPSGVSTNPDKLMTIGQIAKNYKAYVLCSEVFLDNTFTKQEPAVSYGDNMISINSVSKVYGLPGVRIGWVVADENIITKLRRIADYIAGGISHPSEWISFLALKKSDYILERARNIVSKNFKIVAEWLKKQESLKWVEPEGGCVCFIKLPPLIDDGKLSDLLKDKYNTLIVPGDFFWAKGFIRISCGTDEGILKAGLSNITKALNELKGPKY